MLWLYLSINDYPINNWQSKTEKYMFMRNGIIVIITTENKAGPAKNISSNIPLTFLFFTLFPQFYY